MLYHQTSLDRIDYILHIYYIAEIYTFSELCFRLFIDCHGSKCLLIIRSTSKPVNPTKGLLEFWAIGTTLMHKVNEVINCWGWGKVGDVPQVRVWILTFWPPELVVLATRRLRLIRIDFKRT